MTKTTFNYDSTGYIKEDRKYPWGGSKSDSIKIPVLTETEIKHNFKIRYQYQYRESGLISSEIGYDRFLLFFWKKSSYRLRHYDYKYYE